MRPKVVIFDLGGVLTKFVPHYDAEHLVGKCSAGIEAMKQFVRSETWNDYECGKISRADFFKCFKNAVSYQGTDEECLDDFCRIFELDEAMFNLFLTLKVRYGQDVQFWLLSNINELHYEYLRQRWPGLFDNFWRTFLSFQMGARKPDPEIYDRMLQADGASPYTCLFIDDTEVNGAYPRKIQMSFIKFEGVEKLRAALRLFEIEV